ncbi:MAG: exo-alpha-sialidase [Planctomycetota bacterium]|jgi:hypothetical protein
MFEHISIRYGIVTAILLAGMNVLSAATAGEPEQTVVYRSGQNGYHTYRIPALVVTTRGTILAFCEGRKTGRSDHGDIDLLLKRSTDKGRTWSSQQIVHEEGGSKKVTIGNPCAVVDSDTGMVWLTFCRNNDLVFITHSNDDGLTWAKPLEITKDVKDPKWDWYATGPGHGIQLQHGPHKGRLVIPCDCGDSKGWGQWDKKGRSLVIYSDDNGKTWQRGDITEKSMNECEVVELANGTLLLSMRNYRGKNQRAFSISHDGGRTWSKPENHEQVYCPTCQSSIHRYSVTPKNIILYSGPGGPGRIGMTIRASYDEGRNWPVSKQLYAGPSAYSDLACLPDGDIVCLYEGGKKHSYEWIRFARFPPKWLTGADSESTKNATVLNPQWKTIHPRLFFTTEKLQRLGKRIEHEKHFSQAWGKLLQRADRLMEANLVSKEYAEGGTGQHGNYGRPSKQIVDMAGTLGLAYQMTSEKRFAEKLKDSLIHYGHLARWAGDAHRDPPWHSELNTARFCYGYAVGYDSIYDFLSEEERKTIATSMIRLGILPTLDDWILGDKRIHALDSMGHNWWSVCVSMAGLAALSILGDEPEAEQWVQRISQAFPEWFSYKGNVLQNKTTNFDSKGAFYESVSYANYALSEYLLFRLAYSNVFGKPPVPDIPLLDKAGDFFIHTCYPTPDSIMSVNFGDSSLHSTGARTIQMLLANDYNAPQYHWYLNRTDSGINDPVGLVYYELRPQESLPNDFIQSMLYPDIGWAILRSSWQDDSTMLAIKSGFAWNHAHPDAGSFILFHNGKPLIIDSGNCSYSRREYTSYYRHSKAHNVILTNGHGQNPEDCGNGDRGTVTQGRIHRLMDTPGLKYVFADATGPTSWKFSRNYRHFLWIGNVILIFDDVRTHDKAKLEWLLHYQDKIDRQTEDIVLSNKDARAIVRPLFPKGMNILEKKGLKDHAPDMEVPYLAFSPEGTMRECKFVTAVMPIGPEGEKTLPKLELLESKEAIGVRVYQGGKVTDVYLNLRADGRKMHRNSCNIIDGWDTDAYLFAVTRQEGVNKDDPDLAETYFVASGSYLRKNGKVVLDSLSKVYTIFKYGTEQMLIKLEGQPVMNVLLRTTKKPEKVVVNENEVEARYDQTAHAIRIGMNLSR